MFPVINPFIIFAMFHLENEEINSFKNNLAYFRSTFSNALFGTRVSFILDVYFVIPFFVRTLSIVSIIISIYMYTDHFKEYIHLSYVHTREILLLISH